MRLKVIKNCRCPKCRKYEAERIGILYDYDFAKEFAGCLCSHCGFKKKAKIAINKPQKQLL